MKTILSILLGVACLASAELAVLNTFTGGELSPHINARVDFQKYSSGCSTLENMLVLPYGGAIKRPGTQYIAGTKSNSVARLQSMSIGVDQAYVLEFGDYYLRFYTDGQQIVVTNSAAYEVETPYAQEDVFELQFAQLADTMYITHPDYPVYKLERTSTAPDFQLTRVDWAYPPLLEENDDQTKTIWFTSVVTNDTDVVSFYGDSDNKDLKFIRVGTYNGRSEYRQESAPTWSGYFWNTTNWCFWGKGFVREERITSSIDTNAPCYIDAGNWTDQNATDGMGVPYITPYRAITTAGGTVVDGEYNIYSSLPIFNTNQVDSMWRCRYENDNGLIEGTFTGDATSTPVRVEGEWNLRLIGQSGSGSIHYWDGKVYLETCYGTNGPWSVYRVYQSDSFGGEKAANAVNYDRTGEEFESGVYYRIRYDEGDASSAPLKYQLLAYTPYSESLFTITSVSSPTTAVCYVDADFPLSKTNATYLWSEAAFSDYRGHPRCCALYERRLILAGTYTEVNKIWGSQTEDFENFELGEIDSDGLAFLINSDNVITWMTGRDQLYIGTLGGEWVLSGGDASTPLSPSAVLARKQSAYGSQAGVDAILASENVIYVQRGGRKVREFEYSLEADKYMSSDTTLLAEHITESKIKQMAQQQQPEPIIWCIRTDGQLIGLTYNKTQNVYAWHRHVTDGTFESVAVIPTDGEDKVYFVVNRDNGRVIEWMHDQDWGDDDEDAWFVDSGLEYTNAVYSFTSATNTGGYIVFTASTVPANGDRVRFYASTDTNLNNNTYTVTNATATNFMILDGDFIYAVYPDTITVSGANETTVNGIYVYSGLFYGNHSWTNTSGVNVLGMGEYAEGHWIFSSDGSYRASMYYSDDTYLYMPPKVAEDWTAQTWDSPNPTLSYTIPYYSTNSGTFEISKNTFSNLTHLAGQTVAVLGNGVVRSPVTVSTNGVIDFGTNYYTRMQAGLPYSSYLSPMYLESMAADSTSYAKNKTLYKTVFRVHRSGSFQYGVSTNSLWTQTVTLEDPWLSNDYEVDLANIAPTTLRPEFWVVSTNPVPLEVDSMAIWMRVKGLDK